MTLAAYISDSMTLLIFVVFFIPAFSVAENNTCPLYFSGYDGSCMVGSEFQDGDVIFGIMANIHKTTDSRPWCGSLSTPDFESVAMVRWLLRKLELGGYVKGVKFGKIIQNDDILGISNIKGGIWDMVLVSLLLLLLSLLLLVVWWRLWWWWWQGGGGRGGGVAWGLVVVVVVVVVVGLCGRGLSICSNITVLSTRLPCPWFLSSWRISSSRVAGFGPSIRNRKLYGVAGGW